MKYPIRFQFTMAKFNPKTRRIKNNKQKAISKNVRTGSGRA